MKKTKIYLICIVLFCLAVAGIVVKHNDQQQEEATKEYSLLPRKGSMANSAEWKEAQQKSQGLLTALKTNPADTKSALRLAALYIEEARVTGNYLYYDKAALKCTNEVLAQNPSDFNALVFKSLVYLSQHHFADGLVLAHQAQKINPYNGYVYGLLVDGNVEMGNYDSAVVYADKMVSVRPDLTSYSRVSYLREIHGDYQGAIEAMKRAVEAGGQGDEHTEWTRAQLAALYEKTGDYKTAENLYSQSLTLRPNYAYAFAGLGRVAAAQKDYNKAIAYYQRADSFVTDNTVREELSDVYRAAGQTAKADALMKGVIAELSRDSEASNKDESLGHYADRELAHDYLKIANTDKALEHAMLEWNRRPANIDVNETLAWVHYCRGDYAKAVPYIETALKTKSKNPVLLSRAALIYYKAGNTGLAKTTLSQTTPNNPYIDPLLQTETAAMMAKL